MKTSLIKNIAIFTAGAAITITTWLFAASIDANINSFTQYIQNLFVTSDGTPTGDTVLSVDGSGIYVNSGLLSYQASDVLLALDTNGNVITTSITASDGLEDILITGQPWDIVRNDITLVAINLSNNWRVNSLSLPALQTVNNDLSIQDNQALTSLSLDALQTVNNDLYIQYNQALTSLSLPNNIQIGGNLIYLRNNAFNQATVDDILDKLDQAWQINKQLQLEWWSNASPSAAWLVSKSNLQWKWWIVVTN